MSDEFAAALRAAIERRGLSLNRLSRHLAARGTPVTVATLSYWQSGQRRPERGSSLRALEQLEQVLGVGPSSLGKLLGPPRKRTKVDEEEGQRAQFVPDSSRVREALDRLQVPLADRMHRVSIHDRLEIGADRRSTTQHVRQIMQADADGPDRWLIGVFDRHTYRNPRVTGLHNCREGRRVELAEEKAVITELILDKPLRKGESVLVEYLTESEAGEVDVTEHSRLTRSPMRELFLEVSFHPTAVPAQAERWMTLAGDEPTFGPCEIHVGRAETMQLDMAVGELGMRWSWD